MAGLLSKGITVGYKVGSATAFTNVGNVKSVPELGAEPEKVDVTTLTSESKEYIAGLADVSSVEFAVIYTNDGFMAANGIVGQAATWQIKYPDGSTTTFTGSAYIKRGAAEVNGALEFTLGVTVGSKFTHAAATA